MFHNKEKDSKPIPAPVRPHELAERQDFIARHIPLVMEGSQITIDETAIKTVAALEPVYASPLPPNQFKELKDNLKAQFNAAAKPLPFDGRDLEYKPPAPLRTVVMASPEKLATGYTTEEKVEIFDNWFCVRHALLCAGAQIEIVSSSFLNGGFREVYTRDRYVVVGDTAYLPDPDFLTSRNAPRMSLHDMTNYQGEIQQIKRALQQLGVNTVIVKDAWFEGGSVVRHYSSNTLFFGLDSRTSVNDAEKLIEAVNATQSKKWSILPVRLVTSALYHLDLGMSEQLPHGDVMICPSVTDAETFEKIRAIVGSGNIIPLSYNEAAKFATNMIDVGDTLVMSGNCPGLRDDLIDRGYKVIMPADYGREKFEFGEGGVHCMTNDVQQPAAPHKAPKPSI